MRIVLAIGGNALLKKAQFDLDEQKKRAEYFVKKLAKLFDNNEVAVVHGNGPQVGHILRVNKHHYDINVAVAETQAQIGYVIQTAINKRCKKKAVTVVTQVICKERGRPIKPVGRFFGYQKYAELKAKGIRVVKDPAGRGYRRVVFSPIPSQIVEINAVKRLLPYNTVITCGGGGIPVTKRYHELEGVIDKDYAAVLLAKSIKADLLLVATDVKGVALNFKKKNQKWLGRISYKKALKYAKQGHFSEGSMQPKVIACSEFAKHGKTAIICHLKDVEKAMKGEVGTIIR